MGAPVRGGDFLWGVIDLLCQSRSYIFYFNMGERMILQAIFVRSYKNTVMQCLLFGKP
jgi:hypothetical protein